MYFPPPPSGRLPLKEPSGATVAATLVPPGERESVTVPRCGSPARPVTLTDVPVVQIPATGATMTSSGARVSSSALTEVGDGFPTSSAATSGRAFVPSRGATLQVQGPHAIVPGEPLHVSGAKPEP